MLARPSPLTVAERQLIAAYVSGLNQCQFCHGAHSAIAADLGVGKTLFAALLDDVDGAPVVDKIKPVLRYARTLALAPSRLTQADADSVFEAGWDEQSLGDAVAICALFNFCNRIVEGHSIKGNAAYFERLRGFIAKEG
ncbi:MAG TPA: carboxymuconolactone decarboxylase family protein [Alphaproteobacteria bacterium]